MMTPAIAAPPMPPSSRDVPCAAGTLVVPDTPGLVGVGVLLLLRVVDPIVGLLLLSVAATCSRVGLLVWVLITIVVLGKPRLAAVDLLLLFHVGVDVGVLLLSVTVACSRVVSLG